MTALTQCQKGIDRLLRRVWNREWGPGLLAVLALLAVYLFTLQRIISGSDADYVFDAGEMQVALNLWGLPHVPSYPLYVLLSASLVTLFKLLGTNPAAAASSTSLVWSMAALGVTYDLLRRRLMRPWLAALLVLALGLMESFWLHSVIAEVYSLTLLFVALILWLVLADPDAEWTRRRWLLLAALLGFGVGHHREVAFLVPGLAVYLWPEMWAQRRQMPVTLALGMLLALAGLLPYLYIPLYARLGGVWYSGQPDSLAGLWRIINASEWDYIYDPPYNLADFGQHVVFIIAVLRRQLTWPGFVAGLTALVSLFFIPGYSKRAANLLLLSTAAYVGFTFWYPNVVLPQAFLLPVLLLLVVALGDALTYLAGSKLVPMWLALGLLALAIGVFSWRNLPVILAFTRDPDGVAYKAQVATLEPVKADTYFFATPWGPRYLAMAYGLYVTHEYGGFEPVDHNADFEAILAAGDRLVTTPDMLYAYPYEWWVEHVGGQMYLRSAGAGFVEIDNSPLPDSQVPPDSATELDNGVTLAASEVRARDDGIYELALYWQATDPPDENYSVFVHLINAETGDILAQADSYAPVSGWYPVTVWRPDEVVRDEYRVSTPLGFDGPLRLRAGMYRQLEDNSFEELEALNRLLID